MLLRGFAIIIQHKKLLVLIGVYWSLDFELVKISLRPSLAPFLLDYENQTLYGVKHPNISLDLQTKAGQRYYGTTVHQYGRRCGRILESGQHVTTTCKSYIECQFHADFDAYFRDSFAARLLLDYQACACMEATFGYYSILIWLTFLGSLLTSPSIWFPSVLMGMLVFAFRHNTFEPDTLQFYQQTIRLKKEVAYQRAVVLLVYTSVFNLALDVIAVVWGGFTWNSTMAMGFLHLGVLQQSLEERKEGADFYPGFIKDRVIRMKIGFEDLFTSAEDTLERVENAFMSYKMSGVKKDTRYLDALFVDGYSVNLLDEIYANFGQDEVSQSNLFEIGCLQYFRVGILSCLPARVLFLLAVIHVPGFLGLLILGGLLLGSLSSKPSGYDRAADRSDCDFEGPQ